MFWFYIETKFRFYETIVICKFIAVSFYILNNLVIKSRIS